MTGRRAWLIAACLYTLPALGATATSATAPAGAAVATPPTIALPAPGAAPTPATLLGLPDFTALVARFGPSVVNISTRQNPESLPQDFGAGEGIPEDGPLYDFFRRFFGEETPLPDEGDQGRSLGSGFILSADGYVLTNSHVVEAAAEIIVRTSDRREFLARVIGADVRSDIALLKIEGTDLPAVEIGSAADLRVGEWVLAIGSPFGFDHSATAGIVSAMGRTLPSENYVPFIQTDVAINPGNSGGPLFDLSGKVVGVNSQIYSRTGGFMGLSFAIPIEVAIDVVEQLKTRGRVSRGWLGVLIQDVTRELAEPFGMTQPRGALVAQVLPDSPAAAAGLQAGDIILRFDGKDVPTSANLPPLVGAAKVGNRVVVEVVRAGQTQAIAIELAELPDDEEPESAPAALESAPANRIGLVVKDLLDEQRARLGLDAGGVLVEIVEDGPAQTGGIRAGDVILSFDNQPVTDARQFRTLLDGIAPGRAVAVLVQRGDARTFYPIRMPKE